MLEPSFSFRLSGTENASAQGKRRLLTLEIPILSTSHSFYLYLLTPQLPDSFSCILSNLPGPWRFLPRDIVPSQGGQAAGGWQERAAEAGPGQRAPGWPGALTQASVPVSLALSGAADTSQGPYVFFFMQMSPLKLNDRAFHFSW